MPTITGLSEAVSANNADLLPVVQGGETKQISAEKISGLQALGINQTWQDVPGRLQSVLYTNTSGKGILVYAKFTDARAMSLSVDGIETVWNFNTSQSSVTGFVPNGSTYMVNGGGTIFEWRELR